MGSTLWHLWFRAHEVVRCRKLGGLPLEIPIGLPDSGGDEVSLGGKSIRKLFLMIIQQSFVRHNDQSFV